MTHTQPSCPDFPIDLVLTEVRREVADYSPAVMFELADRGFTSLFQQVVSCIISIRTREETTLPVCLRLFETAPDAALLASLTVDDLRNLIRPSTFFEQKASRILAIAELAVNTYGGNLPCSREIVLALPGVGPKCANLALGIACGMPAVAVDIHVHRVVNRWGYVAASTPERTMEALTAVLPERYQIEINKLLVPFGKHICTGDRPWCSRCPVREQCCRVGVTASR